MLLVILLFALFASLFSFSKAALEFTEPFFLVGSRMAFAGLLLMGYQMLWCKERLRHTRHVLSMLILGFFNIFITNIAEIWGIKHMVSAKACLIYSLSPFVTALVAYLILRETMNTRKWLGMSIGFIGFIPTLSIKDDLEMYAGSFWLFSYAELAIIIAVLSSVYGWILLKKILNDFSYSPIMVNGISMLFGGVLALGYSYLQGESWHPVPVTNWVPFLEISLTMCLVSNIICYNLYGFLLKRYSATFMSFAGLVTPLFASLFGWFFLQEKITYHFFISILIFSIGLTIFYIEELKTSR